MPSSEDFGYIKDDEKAGLMTKRIIILCVVLFSLVSFVYITINAYYSQSGKTAERGIKTIKSPDFAIKVVENEEGIGVRNLDQTVYENIVGGKKEKNQDEKIKVIRNAPNPMPSSVAKNKEVVSGKNSITEIPLKSVKENKQIAPGKEILLEKTNDKKPNNAVNLPIRNSPIVVYDANAPASKNVVSSINNPPANSIKTTPKIAPSSKQKFSRVQVVATSSKASAEEYWERLKKQYPQLLLNLDYFIYEANLGQRGIFYRLQIGDFPDQDTAENFCRKFIVQTKKSQADCIVVE